MKADNSMVDLAKDYIAYRRSLGFQFRDDKDGGELLRFGMYAEKINHQGPITTNLAVQWVKKTGKNAPIHSARRLDLIRGFAQYRALFDPRTEIPGQGILGSSRYPRKTPYIYTDQEITALQTAASMIRSKIGLTPKTYEALFGLLACTGLRVSEALALTNGDVNLEEGLLKIRGTKFQKSRLVPLHVSAVAALRGYSEFRNRHYIPAASRQFFLRDAGASLAYYHVRLRFKHLRRKLNWTAQGRTRLPRIHDLRHTFAVRRILRWYQEGCNVDQKIPALATYLGHVNPTKTYWYMTAVPELMAIVGTRFEEFWKAQKGGNYESL
jgi:integrase